MSDLRDAVQPAGRPGEAPTTASASKKCDLPAASVNERSPEWWGVGRSAMG